MHYKRKEIERSPMEVLQPSKKRKLSLVEQVQLILKQLNRDELKEFGVFVSQTLQERFPSLWQDHSQGPLIPTTETEPKEPTNNNNEIITTPSKKRKNEPKEILISPEKQSNKKRKIVTNQTPDKAIMISEVTMTLEKENVTQGKAPGKTSTFSAKKRKEVQKTSGVAIELISNDQIATATSDPKSNEKGKQEKSKEKKKTKAQSQESYYSFFF